MIMFFRHQLITLEDVSGEAEGGGADVPGVAEGGGAGVPAVADRAATTIEKRNIYCVSMTDLSIVCILTILK